MNEKKKFKVPHTYVLLAILIIIATVMTYIVPAGTYEMVEVNGKNVIDPNSFQYIANTPVSFWHMMLAIPRGLVKQASLIFLIIVIGGSIEVVNRTGALEASIGRAAQKSRDRLFIVVPLLVAFFALCGATSIGNSIVAFIPLGVLIAENLGADACVGVAIVTVASNLGFTGGAFNTATTGTAQAICGLPLFSGWEFRALFTVALVVVGSIYMIAVIKKQQRHPELRVKTDEVRDAGLPELTGRRTAVLIAFVIGFGFVTYAAAKNWGAYDAIPAIFIITGVVCGLIYGFSPSEIAEIIVQGAQKMAFTALIVGLSSAISTVLTEGQIIHTVVHALAGCMAGLPASVAAVVMYFVNIVINFFIPSGSGQAAVVMPIMSPLASVMGITQQTTVFAFQLGDGFTNLLIPNSSTLMASIAFAHLSYVDWVKFFWKWLLLNMVVGIIFLVIAAQIGWGPF